MLLLAAGSVRRPCPSAGSGHPVALVDEQKVRPDARETLLFKCFGQVISSAVSVGAVADRLRAAWRGDGCACADRPRRTSRHTGLLHSFGRVRRAKHAIVHALQSHGHTVAMTGDVNDVLALRTRDIGVAMGSGSPASRAVAQIVLAEQRGLPRYVVGVGSSAMNGSPIYS